MVCMYFSRTLHGVLQACYTVHVLVAHFVMAWQRQCGKFAAEAQGLYIQSRTGLPSPAAKYKYSALPSWKTKRRYNLTAPFSCPALMCRDHSCARLQGQDHSSSRVDKVLVETLQNGASSGDVTRIQGAHHLLDKLGEGSAIHDLQGDAVQSDLTHSCNDICGRDALSTFLLAWAWSVLVQCGSNTANLLSCHSSTEVQGLALNTQVIDICGSVFPPAH